MAHEILDIPPSQAGVVWPFRSMQDRHARRHHTHAELECNLVTAGNAAYFVGAERLALRPGHLIWLFPGQPHVLLDEDPQFDMWIMVFRQSLLRLHCTSAATVPLRQIDPGAIVAADLDVEEAEALDRLCASLAEGIEDPAVHDAGLGWLLMRAWRATGQAQSRASGTGLHPAVARAVYRLSRPDDAESLAALARVCGLSPSHLSRLFTRQTGLSIPAFRNRQRIERACRLIDSGLTLTNAGFEAGFGSYAQFHRAFKKVMGLSPADYAREANGSGRTGQKCGSV